MNTRRQLHCAAQCLCDDFASKKDVKSLLSHFSSMVQPSAIEHGEAFLAPFLGRTFVGISSIQSYFELLAQHLTHQNMRFSEYVVDVEERKVAVKGQAEFTWTSSGDKWEETFAYVLDFDDQAKVVRYQVWADSGAAYLARMGELERKRKGI